MEGRAILAPTNKIRDNINAYMMSRLPTEEVVLLSADSTVQPGDSDRYPTEMPVFSHRAYQPTSWFSVPVRPCDS